MLLPSLWELYMKTFFFFQVVRDLISIYTATNIYLYRWVSEKKEQRCFKDVKYLNEFGELWLLMK